jgi:ADP-ribose pyrophosphatase YjhB (NUDIX family)
MNIRPHAQVIVIRDKKIFCCSGYDSIKKEYFYRTVGGGIDFAELAIDAIKREMQEEFAADLVNLQQVGITENIFTHMGNQGHEIVFIFTADFEDDSMYEDKIYPILDNLDAPGAEWHPVEDFISGNNVLYPKAVLDFLKSNAK